LYSLVTNHAFVDGNKRIAIDVEKVGDPKGMEKMGEVGGYPVASEHLQDRKLVLKWVQPIDESHLNWRQ